MTRATAFLIGVALSTTADAAPATNARARVMIVGITHFVAKKDLHNTQLDDVLGARRQNEIVDVIAHLMPFRPTKVMIETPFGDPKIPDRYRAYLAGTYALEANEVYQLGFRLAAAAKNSAIYPIDAIGFPFDYPSVKASAQRNGQTPILDRANASSEASARATDGIVKSGTMLELLRHLNRWEAIHDSAAWYLYVDRVGAGKEYAGADLVSSWYARNLHMFANMTRYISNDDRVVVFVGQGHAKLLREFVEDSPDLELVNPEPFLAP